MQKFYALSYCAIISCSDLSNSDEKLNVEFSEWKNPQTGKIVSLPSDWRHSPQTADQGETVIGYFLPRYAWMMGRYGHITLHREKLASKNIDINLFCERIIGLLTHRTITITETVFSKNDSIHKANFEVELTYKQRNKVLRIFVWSYGHNEYYYAIIEMMSKNRPFIKQAIPIVDQLVQSSNPNILDRRPPIN